MSVWKTRLKTELSKNLGNFPEILVDNDYRIDWVYGGVYTLEALNGYVLNYGKAIVLYQELEVLRVTDKGDYIKVGNTVYTNIVENEDLIRLINEYEKTSEYKQEVLRDQLFYAVQEKIESFGNGTTIRMCEFISNEDDVLLTEDDVLDEILNRFREKLNNFFVDLLYKEEFNKGIYKIDIDSIEVGYESVGGWGVMLVLNVQHYKTLNKREVTLIYPTNVKEEKKVPELEILKVHIQKEIENFVNKNKVSRHFGVEFRFNSIREVDIYRKIRGKDKEEVEKWVSRFLQVIENYREDLREYVQGIEVLEHIGFVITLKTGQKIIFAEGGIMLDEGRYVYIKKEMNLQEGLRNLAHVLGKNKFTLDLMKSYDFRTKVKEVDKIG